MAGGAGNFLGTSSFFLGPGFFGIWGTLNTLFRFKNVKYKQYEKDNRKHTWTDIMK